MNDVCAMQQLLIARYEFAPQNIHILADQDATREGILNAFKRHLIDETQPGDVALFFYSGHGSQVKNTLGGEPDQLDETIVPFDWKRPITKRDDAKDIRDKELFKLFREASKKVTLTALFDSCHSGGVSRSGVAGVETAKTGPAELRFDFAEVPPDKDQEALSDQEYLERNGVLVISAARDDQQAREKEYNHEARGNFSYALATVLQSPNADNLSAGRIFDKLVIQMKSHYAPHDPVIIGSATRRGQTLFGERVDPSRRPEVNVEMVDANGNITLQGGRALGLDEGCEFVRKGDEAKTTPVRIRINKKPDYVKSTAEVIAANATDRVRMAQSIRPNDTFVLETWATAGEPNLNVWIPPAKLTTAQLHLVAQEAAKLRTSDRVELVTDPTITGATHFLSHDGTSWQLRLPSSQTLTLGPTFSAKEVLNKLSLSESKARLFFSLPPSTELAAGIKLGEGSANTAVGLAKTPQQAHYLLVGRAQADGPEISFAYAWLSPEATGGVAPNAQTNEIKLASTSNPLPPITDWKSDAADLVDLALRLGKIRGWIKIESPGDNGRFAYRLVVKDEKGSALSPGANLEEGMIYRFFLVADPASLQPPFEQRHVYVFGIDRSGTSSLFYPNPNRADSALPGLSSYGDAVPPPEIRLADFRICGPDKLRSGCNGVGELGPETYIMLTTAKTEPLPDPFVLASAGVRTPQEIAAKSRGDSSPLSRLLSSIGSTSRSSESRVPLNWSAHQFFFQSVEKKR